LDTPKGPCKSSPTWPNVSYSASPPFFEPFPDRPFQVRHLDRIKIARTVGFIGYHLNFAQVGGLQSQGAKGEAVDGYREPLATQNLKSSGTPEGWKLKRSNDFYFFYSAHPEMAPLTRFLRWATNSNPRNINDIPPV
jgi:hypothetical protein